MEIKKTPRKCLGLGEIFRIFFHNPVSSTSSYSNIAPSFTTMSHVGWEDKCGPAEGLSSTGRNLKRRTPEDQLEMGGLFFLVRNVKEMDTREIVQNHGLIGSVLSSLAHAGMVRKWPI